MLRYELFDKIKYMSERLTKNLIPIAIVVAGLLIGGVIIYVNTTQKCLPESISEVLSSQEAGERLINFINQNLLRGGTTASLVNIVEENGLYKIKIAIEGQEMESYLTLDGKLLFPEVIDLTEVEERAVEKGLTIGDFLISDDEICKEKGKPIVYFFGSESCSHCRWEHPIIEKVAEKFKKDIAFHNNMGNQADRDVFQKYSTGGVPTIVLGCRYYRAGSGERWSEEEEEKVLTALVCKLTGNEPKGVCDEVKDLITKISD